MTIKNPEWEWPMPDSVIVVEGLVKRFGVVERWPASTSRCDVVDSGCARHNGAGKTSLIDILSTRAKPTSAVPRSAASTWCVRPDRYGAASA